jgi:type IV pilus assembly protein PilQ
MIRITSAAIALSFVMTVSARAQLGPKPIVVEKQKESLETRLDRKITLDVREMNLIDVLKFLALKGDFNMVTSATVQGRVTLYLKNVSIRDAMDIVLISNGMAYHREKEIIHVMSEPEYEALYGKRFNDKNVDEIIQLKYAKPSYVLAATESIKSTLGKVIIDEDTGSVVLIDTPASIAEIKKAIAEMEKPLETFIYSLQYAKATFGNKKEGF